jgi:hypothetical protein
VTDLRLAAVVGVPSDITMMRTPDGHSGLELTKYRTAAAPGAGPENPPPNTLGLHRVMFAVDDINDAVAPAAGLLSWMWGGADGYRDVLE